MLISFIVRAARPADLPLDPQGRRAHRRPRRRDVLRHPRRARVRPRDCANCSTTCAAATPSLRKELFAHRRELWLWTSWGLLLSARQRRDRLVRRPSEHGRQRLDRRHHGVPVVHVPAAEPGLEIVNSFSELQRSLARDGARVRGARRCRTTSRTGPDATRRAGASCSEIEFEDVEFEYREDRPVVRDFNVTVPGGSVVALVGRSGAGKTTVTDLVARFHDPTRGRILLNGTDIRDFRLAHLPRPARDRAAGRVPLRRLGARQHRVRPPRRDGRRGRGRRAARQRARVHRQLAGAVRDVHRRARRQALGRPAAAARDRARDPRVAADPDPRRGDQQPRHRERAADPGVDGRRCSRAAPRSSSRTGCPRSAAPT